MLIERRNHGYCKDFKIKQRKYMPVFPKASGKPTIYIEGYPCEDDEPMAATGFHGAQIITLSDQLKRYFAINDLVHIAVDSFIYYSEGDITKVVAPDIHVVFELKNTRCAAVSIRGQKVLFL